MAKVKFGAMVTDARGKLDGIVFTKGRGGAVIRKKVTNVNPNTRKQSLRRSITQLLSKHWSNKLTNAQRKAWSLAAINFPKNDIFGNTKVPTGFGYFMRINFPRGLYWNQWDDAPSFLGTIALNDPPVKFTVGGNVTSVIKYQRGPTSGNPDRIRISLKGELSPALVGPVIWQTPPLPPGVTNFHSKLRLIETYAADNLQAGSLTWDSVTTDYPFPFEQPPAGSIIGMQMGFTDYFTGAQRIAWSGLVPVVNGE